MQKISVKVWFSIIPGNPVPIPFKFSGNFQTEDRYRWRNYRMNSCRRWWVMGENCISPIEANGKHRISIAAVRKIEKSRNSLDRFRFDVWTCSPNIIAPVPIPPEITRKTLNFWNKNFSSIFSNRSHNDENWAMVSIFSDLIYPLRVPISAKFQVISVSYLWILSEMSLTLNFCVGL